MEDALAEGADVNYVNPTSTNAVPCLVQAVYKDFLPGVKLLIDSGVDVNLANPSGWTALVQAGYSGRVECARLLLEADADVQARGKDNDGSLKTPLEFAVKRRHHELAELLRAELRADRLSAVCNDLYIAVTAQNVDRMAAAIQDGADVDYVNPASTNNICSLLQAVYKDFVTGVKLLVDSGADVNLANPTGWTALVQAGYSDRVECARLLLDAGADVNQQGKDSDGTYKTPLEFAHKMGNHDVAALIESKIRERSPYKVACKGLFAAITAKSIERMAKAIGNGADVNHTDSTGTPCLVQAVSKDFVPGVKLLIDVAVDVNVANPKGWTALVQAAYSGRVECARLLLEAGAETEVLGADADGSLETPLEFAVKHGHPELATLIESALLTRADEKEGFCAGLFEAVRAKSVKRMMTAIEAGADVNWVAPDDGAANSSGHSCLMEAVSMSFKDGVYALLENGADVNATTASAWTPLALAAHTGATDCAKALLAAGAKTEPRGLDSEVAAAGGNGNAMGKTALEIAVSRNHKEVAELIIIATGGDVVPDGRAHDPAVNKLLYEAVDTKSTEGIQRAVDLGADLNWTNPSTKNKICALLEAVYKDFPDGVKFLVDHSALVDNSNPTGWTALVQAGYSGRKECTEMLLNAGADTEAKGLDNDGTYKTAFQFAINQNHPELADLIRATAIETSKRGIRCILDGDATMTKLIVKGTLAACHDTTTCGASGMSPITGPLYRKPLVADSALGAQRFRTLCEDAFLKLPDAEKAGYMVIEEPRDVPIPYEEYAKFANQTVQERDIRAALCTLPRMLVCNINIKTVRLVHCQVTDDEAAAMFRALKNNCTVEVIDLSYNTVGTKGASAAWELLKVHAKVKALILCNNQIGDSGVVALPQAIKANGHIIEIDLNCNQISFLRKRELRRAGAYHPSLGKLHLGNPEANKSLFIGVEERSITKLQDAIDLGADIDWINPSTKNRICALLKAVYKNFSKGAKVLLDHGADVDNANPTGWTPLVQAGYSGRVDCVKLLLDNGADTEARGLDNDGTYKSAIEFARKQHFEEVVRLLEETLAERSKRCISQIIEGDRSVSKITIAGPPPAVHDGMVCDASGMSPIVGMRYSKIRGDGELCEAEFAKQSESKKQQYAVILKPGDDPLPYGKSLTTAMKPAPWMAAELQDWVDATVAAEEAVLEIPPGDYFFESSLLISNAKGYELRPMKLSPDSVDRGNDVRLWFLQDHGIQIDGGRNVRIKGGIKVDFSSGAHIQGNQVAQALERESAVRALPGYLSDSVSSEIISVRLQHCRMSDDDAVAICAALADHDSLKDLDLSNNRIASQGANAVWSLLERNSSIIQVNLSNNNISDPGVVRLASAMSINRTLHALDLGENPITPQTIRSLRIDLSDHGSLRKLQLGALAASKELFERGVKKKSLKEMQKAVEMGADLDWHNSKDNQNTALIKAASLGFLEGVQYLLGVGAATDKTNKSGDTALMLAVTCFPSVDSDPDDVLRCVQALLEWGADSRLKNVSNNSSAFDQASSLDIKKLLGEAADAAECLDHLDAGDPLPRIIVYGTQARGCCKTPWTSGRIMTPICRQLKLPTPIVQLRLVDCALTDGDAIQLINGLFPTSAAVITEISLPRNALSDRSVEALLGTFRAKSTDGSNGPGEHLSMSPWPALELLDFAGNMIGDTGLVLIADIAHKCPTLEKLVINDNGIGTEGAEAFGEKMKCNVTVRRMYLAGNNLSGAAMMALRKTLTGDTLLDRLDLGNFTATKELYSAVNSVSTARLMLAIDEGADLNWINPDTPNRICALLQAVYKDFVEGVKLLIEHGANINKSNPTGWTPLIQAVYSDRKECAKLLLEAGAETEHKGVDNDNTYKTAYEFAVSLPSREDMVKIVEEGITQRSEKCITGVLEGLPLAKVDIAGPIPAVHLRVSCDVCGMVPLVGMRFRRVGDNYDCCEGDFICLPDDEKQLYEVVDQAGKEPVPFCDYTRPDFDILSRISSTVARLPAYLDVTPGIVTLRLTHCSITDEDAVALLNVLQSAHHGALREIDLSNNLVGNSGAQSVYQILCGDSSIVKVSLSNNKIGDEGVFGELSLIDALKANVTLRELYLGGNPIAPSIIRMVRVSLSEHKSLRKIQLGVPGASRELYDKGAKAKSIEEMNKALLKGADPDWQNAKDNMNTALMKAASLGFTEGVIHLLEHGAATDKINGHGMTALHHAVAHANLHKPQTYSSIKDALTCVAAFLESGCDVQIQNDEGRTAHDAAHGSATKRMIADASEASLCLARIRVAERAKNVIVYGAHVKARHSASTMDDVVPLLVGYFESGLGAADVDRLRLIDCDLDSGGDAQPGIAEVMDTMASKRVLVTEVGLPRNNLGDAAMVSIASYLAICPQLHTLDLTGNCIGDDGTVALANSISDESGLRYLLLNNNKIGDVGARALGIALTGNTSLFELRMETNRITLEGMMSLRRVLMRHSSVEEMTFGNPVATRQLYKAVDESSMPRMQAAIADGADIDWTNPDTTNKICALLQAVFKDFTEGVKVLIGLGAYVNNYNPTGWTPLVQAGYSGRPECARLLLEAGADTEPKGMDSDGTYKTALEFAKKRSKEEVVTLLEHVTAARTERSIGHLLDGVAMDTIAITMELPAIHTAVHCDCSGLNPIVGTRYHKLGDSFNLCQNEFLKLSAAERAQYEVIERHGDDPIPFTTYLETDNHNSEHLCAKQEPVRAAVEALPTYLAAPAHMGITMLRLTHCRITDKDAVTLLQAVQANNLGAMREIDFSNNLVGNATAQLTWKMVTGGSAIIKVSLSNNKIGDEGVFGELSLVDILKANVTLREFYLGGNPIAPSIIRTVRIALAAHKSLRKFQLGVPGASRELYDKGAKAKSIKEMNKALLKGADPDWQNAKENMNTALMKAASLGFVDGVVHLLEHGAATDIVNNEGNTAAILASHAELAAPASGIDSAACVGALLEWGCNVNVVNNEGKTLLKRAQSDVQTAVKLLVDRAAGAANCLDRMRAKETVPSVVVYGAYVKAPFSGVAMPAVVPLLESYFATAPPESDYLRLVDCDVDDAGVARLLDVVASRGVRLAHIGLPRNRLGDVAVRSIAQYLAVCPHVRTLDLTGNRIGDEGVGILVESILQYPGLQSIVLDNNCVSDAGAELLRSACLASESVEALHLARNRLSGDGIRALMKPPTDDCVNTGLRFELGTYSTCKELYKAVDSKSVQRMLDAIRDGADLDWTNTETTNKICSLLEAVFKDFPDGVRLLLSRGARVDNANPTGWTPLVQAGYSGRYDCAKLLLEWGADTEPKGVDSDGSDKSALEFAIKRNNADVAQLLKDTIAERTKRKFRIKAMKSAEAILLVALRGGTAKVSARSEAVPYLPVELWDLIVKISMSHLEHPT